MFTAMKQLHVHVIRYIREFFSSFGLPGQSPCPVHLTESLFDGGTGITEVFEAGDTPVQCIENVCWATFCRVSNVHVHT